MPLAPDHHDLASQRLNRAPSSLPSSITPYATTYLYSCFRHKNGRHEAQTAFPTRLKLALAVTAGGWTRDSAGYDEQLSASRVDAEIDSAQCLGTANMTALATTGTVILRVDLLCFLVTLIPRSLPVSCILNSHQVVPSDMDRYPLARIASYSRHKSFAPRHCQQREVLSVFSCHRLKVPGWHSAQPFGRAAVRRADCVGLSAGTGMGGTPVRVWTSARTGTSQDALVQCGRT
ncbi:hypothetical protein B0H13DRAFT_1854792 [Mycena leptocephala]|nr:hypothetical protein B0H13DRAFT_1854792 [Mycena leptocephala]